MHSPEQYRICCAVRYLYTYRRCCFYASTEWMCLYVSVSIRTQPYEALDRCGSMCIVYISMEHKHRPGWIFALCIDQNAKRRGRKYRHNNTAKTECGYPSQSVDNIHTAKREKRTHNVETWGETSQRCFGYFVVKCYCSSIALFNSSKNI